MSINLLTCWVSCIQHVQINGSTIVLTTWCVFSEFCKVFPGFTLQLGRSVLRMEKEMTDLNYSWKAMKLSDRMWIHYLTVLCALNTIVLCRKCCFVRNSTFILNFVNYLQKLLLRPGITLAWLTYLFKDLVQSINWCWTKRRTLDCWPRHSLPVIECERWVTRGD